MYNWEEKLPDRKGSGFAIASLVLGIVGLVFVCCFFGFSLLTAIVGMVLGIMSLLQNRQGRGMAAAGTILNGITMVLSVLILVVVILFNVGLKNIGNTNIDVFYDGLPFEIELPEGIYEEDAPARL